MPKKLATSLFMLGISLLVASCSSGNSTEPLNERHGPNSWKKGSIITGKSESGVSLNDFLNPTPSQGAMPVNALLWRASLETASVMPLASVDTFGGTIITEWYAQPQDRTRRIKVAIFILDQELRSDAIRVEVYVQSRPEGASDWQDDGRDRELALRLEDLILTRAREIRSTGILETN
jgi:hypothetical protein